MTGRARWGRTQINELSSSTHPHFLRQIKPQGETDKKAIHLLVQRMPWFWNSLSHPSHGFSLPKLSYLWKSHSSTWIFHDVPHRVVSTPLIQRSNTLPNLIFLYFSRIIFTYPPPTLGFSKLDLMAVFWKCSEASLTDQSALHVPHPQCMPSPHSYPSPCFPQSPVHTPPVC